MALMDKMKAQANQLAQKAQEAGKAGQAKVEDVQARRRSDALLRDLGAAVYAQHTGTGSDNRADVERIVAELKTLEAQSATDSGSTSPGGSSTGASDTSSTPEGGYKLD